MIPKTVIAYGVTTILGLGVIAALIKKYKTVVIETLELLLVVARAIEDSKVDNKELANILKEAEDVREAYLLVALLKLGAK